MKRRQFAFWIGMGLFWLHDKTHAAIVDATAANLMSWSESQQLPRSITQRWVPNENRKWRWFERQSRVQGKWKVTGVTRPMDKVTGAPYEKETGYLAEREVPASVRRYAKELRRKFALAEVDESRRAEHGRPPSKWLRNLNADELRIWLRTIDVPYVGVSGMSFWTHLTRDHFFEEERIRGLNEDDQAKLHSAAHYGY